LQTVEGFERGDDTSLFSLLDDLNISTDEFNLINFEAHQWMLGVIHDKQDVADA